MYMKRLTTLQDLKSLLSCAAPIEIPKVIPCESKKTQFTQPIVFLIKNARVFDSKYSVGKRA